MSEEQQHKIDEAEYDTLMRAVEESGLSALEKDNLRELLGAAYRNLNGDPMEVKVRMLARTDWIQVRHTLAESENLLRIIKAIDGIKASIDDGGATRSFWPLLFAFLNKAKGHLLAALFLLLYYPQGAKIMDGIVRLVRGTP